MLVEIYVRRLPYGLDLKGINAGIPGPESLCSRQNTPAITMVGGSNVLEARTTLTFRDWSVLSALLDFPECTVAQAINGVSGGTARY